MIKIVNVLRIIIPRQHENNVDTNPKVKFEMMLDFNVDIEPHLLALRKKIFLRDNLTSIVCFFLRCKQSDSL
jgi:hypothetical protein